MKTKLKQGERLSSMYNHCGLDMDDWVALNQGKEVDLKTIPDLIKDQVETASKKGDK
jgi:hypothetical protein|tara:strand:+ start:56 stop:226 length:171 start_codon:yes stop_codon:yes gene_type:complete